MLSTLNECQPLPTNHITAAEVLRFRDRAWQTYFTNPAHLDLVERKFGLQQRKNVEDMASVQLKRKLLGDYNDYHQDPIDPIPDLFLRQGDRLSPHGSVKMGGSTCHQHR